MGRRLSPDFRECLAAALDARPTLGEAAQHVRVSVRSLSRWLVRHRRGESLANKPRSSRHPKCSRAGDDELNAQAAAHPVTTRSHERWIVRRRTRRVTRPHLAMCLSGVAVLVAAARTRGTPLTLHEGSKVIVVLNGLRLLRRRKS